MEKITIDKTIRPTQLQPKLFSLIKELSLGNDYKVIVNKDNHPLCVMMSYSLLENMDFPFSVKRNNNFANQVKKYYSNLASDEKDLLNEGIDDLI